MSAVTALKQYYTCVNIIFFFRSTADSNAILFDFVSVAFRLSLNLTTFPLLRTYLPSVLFSTGITLFHRYYDASDFHAGFSRSSVFNLVPQYSVLMRPTWISLRSPLYCHCMPCSKTPENSSNPAQYWFRWYCLLAKGNHRLNLNNKIFGAQSLQLTLTAYNFSCLRLTILVTENGSRLDTKCVGSTLSRQHSQLLA